MIPPHCLQPKHGLSLPPLLLSGCVSRGLCLSVTSRDSENFPPTDPLHHQSPFPKHRLQEHTRPPTHYQRLRTERTGVPREELGVCPAGRLTVWILWLEPRQGGWSLPEVPAPPLPSGTARIGLNPQNSSANTCPPSARPRPPSSPITWRVWTPAPQPAHSRPRGARNQREERGADRPLTRPGGPLTSNQHHLLGAARALRVAGGADEGGVDQPVHQVD